MNLGIFRQFFLWHGISIQEITCGHKFILIGVGNPLEKDNCEIICVKFMQLIVKFIDLTSREETAKSRLDELRAPHPNPNFRKHLITFL